MQNSLVPVIEYFRLRVTCPLTDPWPRGVSSLNKVSGKHRRLQTIFHEYYSLHYTDTSQMFSIFNWIYELINKWLFTANSKNPTVSPDLFLGPPHEKWKEILVSSGFFLWAPSHVLKLLVNTNNAHVTDEELTLSEVLVFTWEVLQWTRLIYA